MTTLAEDPADQDEADASLFCEPNNENGRIISDGDVAMIDFGSTGEETYDDDLEDTDLDHAALLGRHGRRMGGKRAHSGEKAAAQ